MSRINAKEGCLFFTVLTACILSASCTSRSQDSPVPNRPPVIRSITLGPNPFDLRTDLIAQVDTQDPDNDVVQVQYHWYLNDRLLEGEKSPLLRAALLKRGDRVRLDAAPFDGKATGASQNSDVIQVGNTPPSIAEVGIGLKSHEQGDRLQALVDASDRDHDTAQFRYRWRRNGSVIKEGTDDFLELTEVHPRDSVVLEVVPLDQQATGKMFRSDPYLVGNNAPKIVSVPPAPTVRHRYEYIVKAVDSDGDAVSYQLEEAPSGMAINKETGQILWDMTHISGGTHKVKVVAIDDQGGSAFQEFDITLPAQASAQPPAGA